MKNMKTNNEFSFSLTGAVLLTAFIFSSVEAGPLTVTNTFTDGNVLTADELNTNFGDVKTAVDDNDARITALEAAKTKRLYISPYGLRLTAGALVDRIFGSSPGAIRFPDVGVPQADFGFLIPDDHQPGSDPVLEIVWRSLGTSGEVAVLLNFCTRHRIGTVSGSCGISTNGPRPDTSTSPANTIFVSEITLDGATLSAGDYVGFGIFRSATSDTSTDEVGISGISLRYTAIE